MKMSRPISRTPLGADHVPFLSPEPEVRIQNIFERPYENAVAAARTCYSSSGIVLPEQVSGEELSDPEARRRKIAQRDVIAGGIWEAGHHTTIEHSHVQFRLSNVSRQFIWTFLHSHPFYDSEQVSQRYVRVGVGGIAVPPLAGESLEVYRRTTAAQTEAYRELSEALLPVVEAEYFRIFPARRGKPRFASEVRHRAQEVARYVLPVATFAYLYHTVSIITLLRYHRLCEALDAPSEQRIVVRKMTAAVLERDPLLGRFLEDPIPLEEMPEWPFFREALEGEDRRAFAEEFDSSLGGRISRLVDWKARNEETLADAAREVFGLPRAALSDDEAIARVLDPSRNRVLGSSLNLAHHSKLLRVLHHPGYTFRKMLSHAADSQDQRHRSVPASRPSMLAVLGDEPDFYEPELVRRDPAVRASYRRAMEATWDGISRLRALGAPAEFRAYLLPNATVLRFTESADLLGLHHKLAMRLCYNAQEEIWRASLDEAEEVARVNPRIGRYLLPPCGLRHLAGEHPICPEGKRFCGVAVWKLGRADYRRLI
jgi:thymidylate synthase ThyX